MTRHTYATAALDASEGDIYGVSQLLGHASTKTTEAYLHSSQRRKESVARKLAAARKNGR
jgi:integrase